MSNIKSKAHDVPSIIIYMILFNKKRIVVFKATRVLYVRISTT